MRLSDLISKTFYQLTEEEKEFLIIEYKKQVSKELCNNCISTKIEAYNYLKKMANQTTKPKPETKSKYEFKPEFINSEITISGVGVITAQNLTDEIVEAHLLNHPHIQSKAND